MKKLSKFLCCGLLATAMASTMMPTVYAAPDGWVEPPFEPLPEGKADYANLNLTLRNNQMDANHGQEINFDEFDLNKNYRLAFEDIVERKQTIRYFHTTFENLSEDIIQIRVPSSMDITYPEKIIESNDSNRYPHNEININALKEGTAKIKCTVTDIEHPELTRTEIVTLTIRNQVSDEEIMNKDKAKLENISLLSTESSGSKKQVAFQDYTLGTIYDIDFIDEVENKVIGERDKHYYHITFENLSKHIIRISPINTIIEPNEQIVESDPNAEFPYTGIHVRPTAVGTAKIRYTITDLADKNNTRTEIITITVNKSQDEEDKTTVDFTGKDDDIFANQENVGFALENIFYASSDVILNLTLENNPTKLTLPKELLDAAKEKGIGLQVNVTIGDNTTTWNFPTIEKVMDIDIAMHIKDAKEIEGLQAEGLIFSFNHSGELPSGTIIKAYVGDTFQAGERVQLSYYNETLKKLEETKEYSVDVDGYVSVVIPHCSIYVLTKADADLTLSGNKATGDDLIKATATTNPNSGLAISTLILLAGGIALTIKKKAVQ